MSSTSVYDITILNEHPFLVFFGPWTVLGMPGKKLGESKFSWSKNTPLVVGNYYIWNEWICLSNLAKKIEKMD